MSANLKKVAKSAVSSPGEGSLFDSMSTVEVLDSTHTEELVLALCGPIGSPLHEVAHKLKDMLHSAFKYENCNIIRLSAFIDKYANDKGRSISVTPAGRRNDLISLGNEMRRDYGSSILAEFAVHDIRVDRELNGKDKNTDKYISRRSCHIIDSVKNQQELELLRTVYRESLYVVGVFSPVSAREESLQRQGLNAVEIAALMDRDSGEELVEGQTVEETFPQCDFFLRMDANTDTQIRFRVERFLNLILGTQIITPTRSETAMYAAASAASNSACLSRQVGAAVTDAEGEVLAIGWNDVPRASGDIYVTDLLSDPNGDRDKRCWNYGGKCYNDEEKNILAEHIIDVLEDIVPAENRKAALEKVLKNKKLRGLIEFSRSIHAEMHAILKALRQNGDRVRGGRLYVTTYPCHSCARHIIAAGIKEVYFIEPYKKSMAIKLHGDAITESDKSMDKVIIVPYDGVAPARYLSLFKMKKDTRKANGKVIMVSPDLARPKLEKSLEALPTLEGLVVESLIQKKLVSPSGKG